MEQADARVRQGVGDQPRAEATAGAEVDDRTGIRRGTSERGEHRLPQRVPGAAAEQIPKLSGRVVLVVAHRHPQDSPVAPMMTRIVVIMVRSPRGAEPGIDG
jgi:hypothetical protein